MAGLTEYESSNEVETGNQVRLAQALEVMQTVHETKDAVHDVAKKLIEHMEKEELDRRTFVSELHDIRIAIQQVDQKVDTISGEIRVDLERNKSELRRDMNSEYDANIHSLKVEFKAEVEKLRHQLERFSDRIDARDNKLETRLSEYFLKLSKLEAEVLNNSDWLSMGKKILAGILGVLGIGMLVTMGLNLK